MTQETFSSAAAPRSMRAALAERARSSIVAVIAFLTLVDLFATQAILPSLARAYQVTPAAMGFAVNATTIGMALSSLAVAILSQRIDRRLGVVVSLAVLAIPTSLLAIAPDLMTFTGLRVAQGLCMAGAFTLTLAYLGERFTGAQAGPVFAAYITGNVASNLVGRLMSAALADHFGIAANFLVFAVMNLSGALVVYLTLERGLETRAAPPRASDMMRAIADHLRNPRLLSAFAIGFCILFAFIGTFTYVNFVLARPPIGLGMMGIGLVYFVFLPSMFTTPAAGGFVRRFGSRMTVWGGLAVALAGLPLLIAPHLAPVTAGLMLVGVGTFFAQAAATGFVGRIAMTNRGAASSLYLASYFSGGLVGSAALGQIFDRFGWGACVVAIGLALAAAMAFATQMRSEAALAPYHYRD
jgi:MFS transporter, YNFM family, putative membrane transport protein